LAGIKTARGKEISSENKTARKKNGAAEGGKATRARQVTLTSTKNMIVVKVFVFRKKDIRGALFMSAYTGSDF